MSQGRQKRPRTTYDVGSLTNAPQQERSRELSQRILEAAERQLKRDGIENFTIAAVASEASVSVGGLYGRFKNREELLIAIRTHRLDRLQQRMIEAMAGPFANLGEVLAAYAHSIVDFYDLEGPLPPVNQDPSRTDPGAAAERNTRQALVNACEPFRTQIKHPEPDQALKMVARVVAASVVRELRAIRGVGDRRMGWDALRKELPRMAEGYLLYQPAKSDRRK